MKNADKILQAIKRHGDITAKQVAEQFEMTTMGARQHLQSLEQDGLVSFYDVKAKIGRPTRHWKLTQHGHDEFTDRHGELTIQVIDAVESLFGKEGLAKVTKEREQKTLAQYREALSHCVDLDDKLAKIAELREREGYMVELEKTASGYKLVENHCPICKAAQTCPSLCQSELNIFKALLEGECDVVREEHIIAGQRRCCYDIFSLK